MAALEKIEVRNRWTGNVQFTAEVEVSEWMTPRFKLGLAVRWARENDAVLSGADLSDADLSGAVLSGADLSDADLSGAVLSGADLSGAVLSGADLSDADLSGAVLSDADLSGAVLSGAVLRDAVLRDAVLRGAVLSDAVLSGAVLRDAVLRGAVLSDAVLSGAVLSGAVLRDAVLRDAVLRGAVLSDAVLSDAGLPPVSIPNIHQAVYEAASQPGALDMAAWHCGTAHCRAGWVITLAGEGGKTLEWAMGTPAAAAMIYLASDPKLERIPDFYSSNAAALADMKAMAEAESSTAEA